MTNQAASRLREARADWAPPPFIESPGLAITIDKDACTGCDLCVLVCPTDCLDLDTEVKVAYILRLDACILCHSCEEVCRPDCLHVLLEPREGLGRGSRERRAE